MIFDNWRHYFPLLFKWEKKLTNNGWQYLSSGKNRRVIKRNNVVIKIPYKPKGAIDNINEFLIYKKHKGIYAPCKLLLNHCLMMRYVDVMSDHIPLWAENLKDGPQIGVNKDKKILIYDYAEEAF